ARVDSHVTARAPGQGQGATERVRTAARRGRRRENRSRRNLYSARSAARRRRRRSARHSQGLWRPAAHRRHGLHAAARRHRRCDRSQRRRQDDAVQDADGRGAAGRRHVQDRRDREDRLRRSIAGFPQRRQDRVGGDLRRRGRDHPRQEDGELACLRVVVQFQGPRPATEGGDALGWSAESRASRQAAPAGLQPPAARRADERSRRRHAARARVRAPRIPRLRRLHLARPLVPRSHRHAHARLRGRQPRGVVRGELPGVRNRQETPARRWRGSAPPHQVQKADEMTGQRAFALLLTFALCPLPFALAGCSGKQTRFLSIATGGTGGVYYPYGGALARLISEKIPNTQATAEVTAASVDNLKLMQLGKVDLAFTLADTLAEAVNGTGPFKETGAVGSVRTLAVLYTNYTHIVVRQGSGINRVADLKGHTVSVGAPGSGTELIADRVLAAAGLDPRRDITRHSLPVSESAGALKDGKVDAFFWSGGLPTASIQDLAATPGLSIALLSSDDLVPRLQADFGKDLYSVAVIPGGSYR